MFESTRSLITRGIRKASNLRVVDKRKGFELIEVHTLEKIFKKYRVDCVLDVGANIGQYANLLRRKVGYQGTLISFEPQPSLFRNLDERASNDKAWHVEALAISSEDGAAQFNVSYGSEFSSLSKSIDQNQKRFYGADAIYQTIEVRTETLETALRRLKRDLNFERPFLKLDTQGFDHNIIMSSVHIMNEFIGFQTELSVLPIYESSFNYIEAIKIYKDLGFSPCAFFNNNYGHFPHLYEIDGIFLRNDIIS
jgi:FkbM family methyltransferase